MNTNHPSTNHSTTDHLIGSATTGISTTGRKASAARKAILAASMCASAAMLAAPPASAHVTVQTYGSTPMSGSYGQAFLRVPHGCEGDATNRFEVRIPDGVTRVKAQAIPGWKVTTTSDASGVRSVTWSGGQLPDDQFADFGLSVKWPTLNDGEDSRTLHFLAVQNCDADLDVTRDGKVATISGRLPDMAGKQVGLFVGTKRLTNVTVGSDGKLSVEVPSRQVAQGATVIAQRGGKQVGTSVNGTQAWVQVPGPGQYPHDLDRPAASVTVTAAAGHAGH